MGSFPAPDLKGSETGKDGGLDVTTKGNTRTHGVEDEGPGHSHYLKEKVSDGVHRRDLVGSVFYCILSWVISVLSTEDLSPTHITSRLSNLF